jgi:hypothetical protein
MFELDTPLLCHTGEKTGSGRGRGTGKAIHGSGTGGGGGGGDSPNQGGVLFHMCKFLSPIWKPPSKLLWGCGSQMFPPDFPLSSTV